jgi:hypothetical protein
MKGNKDAPVPAVKAPAPKAGAAPKAKPVFAAQ